MSLPDGLYDKLLDETLVTEIKSLIDAKHADIVRLTAGARSTRLAEAIGTLVAEALDNVELDEEGTPREQAQLTLIGGLLGILRRSAKLEVLPDWQSPVSVLRSIHRQTTPFLPPATGVLRPWLFTAGRVDPSLLADLRGELDSADDVDILVSFIKWSGVRKLIDRFESGAVTDAAGKPKRRVRILTTTYMGATETRALVALGQLAGVTIKISYDTRRTRLHAKAWLFQRATGFGSAYVGSANVSGAALIGGLEWTVKFSQAGQSDLYTAARAQFESLWNDSEFELFNANNDIDIRRLAVALRQEGTSGIAGDPTVWFDLTPKAYQVEMLNRLARERELGRRRNLLVAATGTGKTVVAALDYRVSRAGGNPRLLFVAHRVEILRQAMATYRQALRTPDFGELLAEGREPTSYDHLFASISSVESRQLIARFGADYWHTVVIDECHHLPAASFDRFARAITPTILLGLTATPFRADGKSINDYFDRRPDERPAVELRLWNALDQQLLAPFEYYGTNDATDLSSVTWDGTAVETAALDKIISGDDVRAKLVMNALLKYCSDINSVKAIAFCVSVKHAAFMAEKFSAAGIPSVSVTGQTDRNIREGIPGRLTSGEIRIVCTCDLYNEGVDLPDVNALLLLRPTQSPVLFEQQLGRGLRLAQDKDSCLVLDFVGRHRQDFRFDQILQVMTGLSRRQLIEEIEGGFPTLPPGCHISFDRVSREQVLANLRFVASQNWPRLTKELRAYANLHGATNVALASFLHDSALELSDIYRTNVIAGWTNLRRNAGLIEAEGSEEETYLSRRLSDLLHATDPACLALWRHLAENGKSAWETLSATDRVRTQMLAYQIFPKQSDKMDGAIFLERIEQHPHVRRELGELAALLASRSDLRLTPLPGAPESWPLTLHAQYESREILSAVKWLNADSRQPFQSGKIALTDHKCELLFVTLDKSEGYHDRIAYHDYAISPDIFHWQTQNSASLSTPSGRRYNESPENGWKFFLFVRESRKTSYFALGHVEKISIEGDKPMSIQWRLGTPLPIDLFRSFSVLRT
jgi:superfamily II DNA or RNA helicase/HKD family nuclease